MAYQPYADTSYYQHEYMGTAIAENQLKYLKQASRHIDTLTYNRIVANGFDNLAPFQQDIIKEVVCRQADFEYTNADMLDSVLSSYSINGVSMSFGANWNIEIQKGIAMKKDVYALLSQTGLTCKLLR